MTNLLTINIKKNLSVGNNYEKNYKLLSCQTYLYVDITKHLIWIKSE
jgi:hypothetical protein